MIVAVSSAASAIRSTATTAAPSRAYVTAAALPLPQPGPDEPAPNTNATLPSTRFIRLSFSPSGSDLTQFHWKRGNGGMGVERHGQQTHRQSLRRRRAQIN